MDISRTTVTEMYEKVLYKVAECLIQINQLQAYQAAIIKSVQDRNPATGSLEEKNAFIKRKGYNIMRIAVTNENGETFQHFGRTEHFKVYDIDDSKILSSQIIDYEGLGHGALAGFTESNEIEVLICGGDQAALINTDIKLYRGVCGNTDAAVHDMLESKPEYNPDVNCNHHEHEDVQSYGSNRCLNRRCY